LTDNKRFSNKKTESKSNKENKENKKWVTYQDKKNQRNGQ
jgi:hypothetical protein